MSNNRYQVLFTDAALEQLEEKFRYISNVLNERLTASKWYARLREAIMSDLAFMPLKYPLCRNEVWAKMGIHSFTVQNDIILYSVDEGERTVYINAVYSRGWDITKD